MQMQNQYFRCSLTLCSAAGSSAVPCPRSKAYSLCTLPVHLMISVASDQVSRQHAERSVPHLRRSALQPVVSTSRPAYEPRKVRGGSLIGVTQQQRRTAAAAATAVTAAGQQVSRSARSARSAGQQDPDTERAACIAREAVLRGHAYAR